MYYTSVREPYPHLSRPTTRAETRTEAAQKKDTMINGPKLMAQTLDC